MVLLRGHSLPHSRSLSTLNPSHNFVSFVQGFCSSNGNIILVSQ